jgi:hypothetical protein
MASETVLGPEAPKSQWNRGHVLMPGTIRIQLDASTFSYLPILEQ